MAANICNYLQRTVVYIGILKAEILRQHSYSKSHKKTVDQSIVVVVILLSSGLFNF